jgi:aspartate kinase
MEENISEIFSLFHEFKLKVNLIQNTAISFSVCVEDKFDNFNELNAILSKKIQSRLQSKCNFTIRHFNDSAADSREWQKVVLKQISTETMQIVTSEWQLLDYYSPIDCGDFINVGSILSRLDGFIRLY